MEPPSGPFWDRVAAYRAMGLDPLKWIAGCSVEVEREEVLYPALSLAHDRLASLAVTVQPGDGPDVFELRDKPPLPQRVLVRTGAAPQIPREQSQGNPLRATLAMRVFQKRADSPETFASELVRTLGALPGLTLPGGPSLNVPLTIGGLHAVATPQEAAEVALFEVYHAGEGRARGHRAVACNTLQVTDASLDPLSEEHAAAVVCAALSGLFTIGVTEQISLDPIFDGPGRKATDALAANFLAVAKKHRLGFIERPPLGTGKLFLGAAVLGHTLRSVPNRHQYVKRGMQVTLTRRFGELAALAAYLSCLADPEQKAKLAGAGLSLDDLERARGTSLEALTTPARAGGEVIAAFSPPFQEPPDVNEHIAATLDAGARGVFGFLDFARRWNVGLRLDALPLADPRISAFATAAFLMDNSTASAPGCIAIVGTPGVLDEVDQALRAKGLSPARVARVVSRGEPSLEVPPEVALAVASKHLLRGAKVSEGRGPVIGP